MTNNQSNELDASADKPSYYDRWIPLLRVGDGEVVSAAEMRSAVPDIETRGNTLTLTIPIPPANPDERSNRSTTRTFVKVESGWQRVIRKPAWTTPLVAWAVGGIFGLRQYFAHRPDPSMDDGASAWLLAVVCFLAGLIVWWIDWVRYKKGDC